jgi:hypothetical protein
MVGPLRIQCSGHDDSNHLNELFKDVLTWPHIESIPSFVNRHIVRVRLEGKPRGVTPRHFLVTRNLPAK